MSSKIIILSGAASDFGKLNGLVEKREGISVPWICFINKTYFPEQPTHHNNILNDAFFDSEFIITSEEKTDEKTADRFVKYLITPIKQNRPDSSVAIVIHDNEAVTKRMQGKAGLYYQVRDELIKNNFEDVLIWPFYHEDKDWIHPTLDDFISKIANYAQSVQKGYETNLKDILASFEDLRKKIENGPNWERELANGDLIGIVKHQIRNNFVLSIGMVVDFYRKPNQEKFQKIHRVLIKTGALDHAGKLLYDLKAKLKQDFPQENLEIKRMETSLARIRSLLGNTYQENEWRPNQLKALKESIEYLSDKK